MASLRRAALGLVLAAAFAQPARASIFDLLPDALQAGGMSRLPGDQTPDKKRTILLNGVPMNIQIGRTERPVSAVLDHYQAKYKGGILEEVLHRPSSVRHEGPQGGSLVSVEVKDRATAVRVAEMKQELLTAGPLRMVQARRNGLFTDYLIIWTDQPLPADVLGAGEASRDAPGQDPPGVPRPQGPRTFSFIEAAAGYSLTMYRANSTPESALREVSTRMEGAGYAEDAGFAAAARSKGKRVARFTREQKDVVITARAQDGQSQLVYLVRDLP